VKEKGKALMRVGGAYWDQRPLSIDMISYCCIDTAPMFLLFTSLLEKPWVRIQQHHFIGGFCDQIDDESIVIRVFPKPFYALRPAGGHPWLAC
jgi:hypothetical protein